MKYISIASGSKGNCHLVQKKDNCILIDAGLSGKATIDAINMHDIDTSKIRAIFITHEHSDHIKGAGIISRKFDIPIYATELTWDAMSNKIGNIKEEHIKIIENADKVCVGDLEISSVPVKHDAADPVAYKVTDGKRVLSIITDLGLVTKKVFDFVKKSNAIVLESNHDINMLEAGPYSYELKRRIKSNFGHLSNDSAGVVGVDLVKSGVSNIMLAHLSEQNNMPILAYQSVLTILSEQDIKVGADVELCVLQQNSVSKKIAI